MKNSELEAVTSPIAPRFKSLGISNGAVLKQMLLKYHDGDISLEQLVAVFKQVEHGHQRQGRSIDDWRNRVNAETGVDLKPPRVVVKKKQSPGATPTNYCW